MKRTFHALASVLCGALLLSCSKNPSFQSTLDKMWQWDGGVEASRVFQRTEKAKAPVDVPAAVGVTGRGLVGRALPAGKLWTYEGEVDVLPTLVGDMVLFSGEGKVIGLDVTTGARRFVVSIHGRRLEGAGYDGIHSILLLVDSDDAREDQILVVGPRGERVLEVSATARLGTPAALDSVGLVPYSGQYIGAVDLKSGKHIGRILIRDSVHRIKAENGQMMVYGAGATPFTSRIASAPDSQSLKLAERKFPGEPVWPVDGSKPRPLRAAPVALYAEPIEKEGVTKFAEGTYVATYYQIALGLFHGNNRIRWVSHFDRTIIGGDSSPTGVTLCLEDGHIVRLDLRDGSRLPFGSLESRLEACVVTASPEKQPRGKREPVLDQIVGAISGTGPDMTSIKKELLEELRITNREETTLALIRIAQDPMISGEIARHAGKLLSQQRKGAPYMIAALLEGAPETQKPSTQSPSAEETTPPETPTQDSQDSPMRGLAKRPPPVGFIAQALLAMKTEGAAQALAPYLNDPTQSAKDVELIMTTVLALGDAAQVPQVKVFVESYKNTGGEANLFDALVIGVQFLEMHLPEEEKAALTESLNQTLTHPELTKRLKKLEDAQKKEDAEKTPKADATP